VLVDSLAGVALLEAHGTPRHADAPFNVLLEMGRPGGRTGCRSADDAMRVARAIAASPAVRLSGVECFEGLDMTSDDAADRRMVDGWIQAVHAVALQCHAEQLYGTPEVTLSAGGSAVFDLVARGLPMPLSRPVRTILRSGCYLTHDSGMYTRFARTMRARNGAAWPEGDGLRPALEIWTHVQSRPESGLAILAFGKRDASFDIDLPVPLARVRDGEPRVPLDPAFRIVKLNDQHAYMEVPADADVRVGDLVGCGISHPCTTFDKWRWMPIVDDGYAVTGAILTFF
jgi:D-serine dehydratase